MIYRLALIISLTFYSLTTFSQNTEEPDFTGCPSDEQRYAVYFINGILVKKNGAKKTRTVLRHLVRQEAVKKGVSPGCVFVGYSYNESKTLNEGSPFHDIYQAYSSAVDQNGLPGFIKFLTESARSWSEVESFFANDPQRALISQIISNALEGTENIDLQTDQAVAEHYAVYEQVINDYNANIILVGHSQGNFLANDTYAKAETKGTTNSFSVVGIATPSSYVAPFRVTDNPKEDYPYTTNPIDAINGVLNNLDANDEYQLPCVILPSTRLQSLLGIFCHLAGTYLAVEPYKENILSDIFSVIDQNSSEAERITDFSSTSAVINEALFFRAGIYFTGRLSSSGLSKVYEALGDETAPKNLTSINLLDYTMSSLRVHNQQLYVIGRNTTELTHSLFRYRGEPIVPFNYEAVCLEGGSCPTTFSHITTVAGKLIAFINTGSTVDAYVLNDAGTALRPVTGTFGTELFGHSDFIEVGDRIYFKAGSSGGTGVKIWSTNSDFVGAKLETDTNHFYKSNVSIANLTEFNEKLFFTSKEGGGSYAVNRLWSLGPDLVLHYEMPGGSAFPTRVFTTNNRLYFTIGHNNQLMSTDGTLENQAVYTVTKVLDVAVVDGVLHFTAGLRGAAGNGPTKLYRVLESGSSVSTIEELHSYAKDMKGLRAWGGEAYFIDSNLKKVATDGTVEPVNPEGVSVQKIVVSDDSGLYFQATDPSNGNELWKLQ